MASLIFLAALCLVRRPATTAQAWSPPSVLPRRPKCDYDLVVIGAGASGLYAAGTSSSLGYRTLLVEKVSASGVEEPDRTEFFVGGDCTNAACVPSKSVWSVARMASRALRTGRLSGEAALAGDGEEEAASSPTFAARWTKLARDHASETVGKVRGRESVSRIARSPNLDLAFVRSCRFVSGREMELIEHRNSTWLDDDDGDAAIGGDGVGDGTVEGSGEDADASSPPPPTRRRVVSSRRFLVATGASPIVPPALERAAADAGLPLLTYRTLLRPDGGGRGPNSGDVWDLFGDDDAGRRSAEGIRVVVAGGGATACELGQSLARLGADVTIAAPSILPGEDVSLRRSAAAALQNDGARLLLGRRVVDVAKAAAANNATEADDDDDGSDGLLIRPRPIWRSHQPAPQRPQRQRQPAGWHQRDRSRSESRAVLLDDGAALPADCLLLCLGRTPGPSLATLCLENAGVEWTRERGVETDARLRSVSAPTVYACGDCASAVDRRDRRAIHAGWTGFHAAKNALVPFFLRSDAVHPAVPRVVYTDPELASVGPSREECMRKYGRDGFRFLSVPEVGTDRADMESKERDATANFVELRASVAGAGRILGGTACGPSAAEIVNEIGLAISAKLTVRDVARSLHSYPSHGYLLYRIAASMATSSVLGLLAGCGPVGQVISALGGAAARALSALRFRWLPWRKASQQRSRDWEARGAGGSVIIQRPPEERSSHATDGGDLESAGVADTCRAPNSQGDLRFEVMSYEDARDNDEIFEGLRSGQLQGTVIGSEGFLRWIRDEPQKHSGK